MQLYLMNQFDYNRSSEWLAAQICKANDSQPAQWVREKFRKINWQHVANYVIRAILKVLAVLALFILAVAIVVLGAIWEIAKRHNPKAVEFVLSFAAKYLEIQNDLIGQRADAPTNQRVDSQKTEPATRNRAGGAQRTRRNSTQRKQGSKGGSARKTNCTTKKTETLLVGGEAG